MHSKLGFLLLCGKSIYSLSNCRNSIARCALFHFLTSPLSNRPKFTQNKLGISPYSYHFLSSHRHFSGYAVEQFSDDEYECDFETNSASSSVANVDEWKWKLSLLLRNEQEQEIVSKDKRDRRDFEQISNLARRMGLYCEIYGKVVVASKVPLPNYRPDLDDKRPQREVAIPLSVQRRVEGLLQEHLDKIQLDSGKPSDGALECKTTDADKNITLDENLNAMFDDSVMERILQRRSLRLRNMQRAWQVVCLLYEISIMTNGLVRSNWFDFLMSCCQR